VCVCVVSGAAVSNRRHRRLYSAIWLDLVNSEWEGASRGGAVVYFRIPFRHSPCKTDEDREKLQDIVRLVRIRTFGSRIVLSSPLAAGRERERIRDGINEETEDRTKVF